MTTIYDARQGGEFFAAHEFDQPQALGLEAGLDMDFTMMDGLPNLGEWDVSWVDLNFDLESLQAPSPAEPLADFSVLGVGPTDHVGQLDGFADSLIDVDWLAGGATGGLGSLDRFQLDIDALGFGTGNLLGLGDVYPAVDGLFPMEVDLINASSPSTVSMPTTPNDAPSTPAAFLPLSSSSTCHSPATTHRCPSCPESFPTAYQLSKHRRQHVKPERCPVCNVRKAALRDLHRHIWTDHKEFAELAGVPSEVRTCPVGGCGYTGRKDNIARHCKKKHGKELKWRRGEPYMA